MTWLSTCISEYIAFPFSLNEDFIAVQYFLKDLLASTLMLQRHTSWYLCTLQNPLFSFNFDLQSCYLFEVFNKSKTKLNNMDLIILTNLIINFKMIEGSSIPCEWLILFMPVRHNRVGKLIILTRLCVKLLNAADFASDKIPADTTFEYTWVFLFTFIAQIF